MEGALKAKIYKFADYSVEVIHNPAHNLSSFLQDELVAECTELSRDSFENPNIKEEFVRHCVLNSSTILFGRDYEGRLFGYSSNSLKMVDNYHIIYLQAVAILKRLQGRGLRPLLHAIKMLEDINKIENTGVNPSHILLAGRTQNPLAFKFYARQVGLFPQPDGKMDQNIRNLGKKVVYALYSEHYRENGTQILFDDQYFVERGAYKSVTQTSSHGIYLSGIPYCRDDDEINQYMDQHLNWQNGDAIILLGYYKDEPVKKMFENAKQNMGFFGVEEIDPEEVVAMSYA